MKLAHDLRHIARSEKFKRGRAKGMRPWSQIVGITWHQTASGALDEDHPKLLAIPAHILLHRNGDYSLLHHFDHIVWHGNALNGGTIGIEIDCRAAGVEGDPDTFWISKRERAAGKGYADLVQEASPQQLYMIPKLMKMCCDEALARGGQILGNWAHRQGHSSRTSDPGSTIWKQVERAQVQLGYPFNDYRDRALGTGKPIPAEWRLS